MGIVVDEPNVVATVSASDANVIYVVDGRICTQGSSSSAYSRHFSFDKTIYNVLSMRDDMKIIAYPDSIKNEFDLFLQYAEAKTNGAIDADFDLFDEYLGSIGITKTICEV